MLVLSRKVHPSWIAGTCYLRGGLHIDARATPTILAEEDERGMDMLENTANHTPIYPISMMQQ